MARKPKQPRPKKTADRKRRDRGDGAVFWSEERQVYIGRKIVGYSKTGKAILKQVSHKKRTEVKNRLKELKAPGDEVTVAEWSAIWMKTLSVRDSTRDSYANDLKNHVIPALGNHALGAVRASDIDTFAADLRGKGIGPNTLRKIMAKVRAMFIAAVTDDRIAKNPAAKTMRKCKAAKKVINPFTPGEMKRIVEAGASSAMTGGRTIAVLAGLGCRMGEATALDVTDYDRATGIVSITKTYDRIFGTRDPKSVHSTRTIRVPLPIRPVIEAAIGDRTDGPLLGRKGWRIYRDIVERDFRLLLAELGVADRNPHQLRHSVATILISDGVPIGDVAKFLGDTAETVVRTYLHAAGGDPSLNMDRILG